MQHMTTALSKAKPALSGELTPAQKDEIGSLFDRLTGQLGAKIADLFGGADPAVVQSEWAAGLSGFRRSEIERGLAACRTRAFAPTLGEFTRMCRPCLDPEWAWLEAGHCLRQRDAGEVGDWSHPAVYRAACEMSMEARAGDWKANRTRWTFVLQRQLEAGWSDIPEPALRIAAEERKTGPAPEFVREKLKALRASFYVAPESADDQKGAL